MGQSCSTNESNMLIWSSLVSWSKGEQADPMEREVAWLQACAQTPRAQPKYFNAFEEFEPVVVTTWQVLICTPDEI